MSGLAISAIVAGSIAVYALVVGLYRGLIGEDRWDGDDPLWAVAGMLWPIALVAAPPIWLGVKLARSAADLGVWLGERRREKRKLPRAEVRRG